MTVPLPPIATGPAQPGPDPARDANAHNDVAAVDTDSDGLTDDFEKLALTNPLSADSDADGLTRDGVLDTDLDGLSDHFEMQVGTNPAVADSDLDELPDGLEVTLGTDPTKLDTDGDGINDGIEVTFGANPLQQDAGAGYHAPAVPAPVSAAAVPVPTSTPATQAVHGQVGGSGSVQHLIDAAMAQVGDDYVYGVEVAETNPDPQVWDCAEFTQWSAYQAGAEIPGSSFEQCLDLKAEGLLIRVEEGMNTPGALLFHFSSEPQPGGGRPSQAHVALSLGGGRTVEAQNEDVGVITDDAGGRFEYAALLPNVDDAGTGDDQPSTPDAAPDPSVGGMPDATGLAQDMVIYGIKVQESRGDYQAENPTSTASGAYQYIDGTWDGYQGYRHAGDAPAAVQDAKMRQDTQAAFDRLGDWERVIASHFAGEGGQRGPKSHRDRVPGHDYNQNPSIREYVDGVEHHVEDADPGMFGPAAHHAGIDIPDGGAAQYLDLKAKVLLIPVEQAARTPWALLFSFSSEPTVGGERPTVAHVAISQGTGYAVEADETRGVTSMQVGDRLQCAAVLPGLQEGCTSAPTPCMPGRRRQPVTRWARRCHRPPVPTHWPMTIRRALTSASRCTDVSP